MSTTILLSINFLVIIYLQLTDHTSKIQLTIHYLLLYSFIFHISITIYNTKYEIFQLFSMYIVYKI